jgi:hypothetical protein
MPTENKVQPEVKRYRFKDAAGEYVYAGEFDNAVRCFLDAAERCIAAERREAELQLRLNAADQRIDELTAKPSDAERERLMGIVEQYPSGDQLEYTAAVRKLQQ